jgi:hypothetical protein
LPEKKINTNGSLGFLVRKYVQNLQLAKKNWKKSTSCVVSMEPKILDVESRFGRPGLKLSTFTHLHGISPLVGLIKFWLCKQN